MTSHLLTGVAVLAEGRLQSGSAHSHFLIQYCRERSSLLHHPWCGSCWCMLALPFASCVSFILHDDSAGATPTSPIRPNAIPPAAIIEYSIQSRTTGFSSRDQHWHLTPRLNATCRGGDSERCAEKLRGRKLLVRKAGGETFDRADVNSFRDARIGQTSADNVRYCSARKLWTVSCVYFLSIISTSHASIIKQSVMFYG